TRAGEPLLVEWVNALPSQHFLPVDHTIHGAEPDKPAVRTVVHLHGAKTGPESDGYPEDWIVPGKSSLFYDRLLTHDAQLLYPVSPDPESPWIPELSGNAILVNGKLFPYLEVEPRKYRFRVLNASNARIYRLSLSENSSATDVPFHQVGTDQGLLPAPVPLTN